MHKIPGELQQIESLRLLVGHQSFHGKEFGFMKKGAIAGMYIMLQKGCCYMCVRGMDRQRVTGSSEVWAVAHAV